MSLKDQVVESDLVYRSTPEAGIYTLKLSDYYALGIHASVLRGSICHFPVFPSKRPVQTCTGDKSVELAKSKKPFRPQRISVGYVWRKKIEAVDQKRI